MNLPSLDNPPLTETVLGVQFDPLENFSNAHLGLFWQELEEEWASIEDHQPIEPSFEQFKGKPSFHPQQFQVKLSKDPASRLQIRNAEKTRMIQLQNGRFHYNWIKRSEEDDYPRYDQIQKEFDEYFNLFKEFLTEQNFQGFSPNQWEVTYVNQFVKGEIWDQPAEMNKLFSFMSDHQEISKQILEGINFSLRYEIKPELGRVHVNIQNGTKEVEGEEKETIVMKLTARGPVDEEDEQSLTLREGLDEGRERIVRSFFALTSEEAQEFWGKT